MLVKMSNSLLSARSIFVLTSFLLLSASALANKRLAVTEWFYPYQIVSTDNKLSGYSIELAHMLFELTGEEGEIELLPWSVAYNKALKEPNVLIFSIGRNSVREEQFHWIGPIAKDVLYFFVLRDSKIKASDKLEDFKQYRVTVVKDATTHQYLSEANFPYIYPMPATDSNADEQVRIKMLMNQRADLLIASRGAVDWSLKQLGLSADTLKTVYRASPLDSQVYFAFNKNSDQELVKRYQRAMEQIKSSDAYTALRAKWKVE